VRAKAVAEDGGEGAGCSDDSKGVCLRRKGCECVDCREVGAIETDLQQERLRASMRLLEQEHAQHASAPGELLPHATTPAHTCLVIVPAEEPNRVEEHTPLRAASAAGSGGLEQNPAILSNGAGGWSQWGQDSAEEQEGGDERRTAATAPSSGAAERGPSGGNGHGVQLEQEHEPASGSAAEHKQEPEREATGGAGAETETAQASSETNALRSTVPLLCEEQAQEKGQEVIKNVVEGPGEQETRGKPSALLGSRLWQERLQGADALVDKAASALSREEAGQVVTGVGDSNVAVQERVLDAALILCLTAPPGVMEELGRDLASVVIGKAFGQSKCKRKAQNVLVALLARPECSGAVLDLLAAACEHRQPKVATSSAETLLQALQHPKPPLLAQATLFAKAKSALVKVSVSVFDSTVEGVRANAVALAVQLLRLGLAKRSCYNNVRAAQQKELELALANPVQVQATAVVHGTTPPPPALHAPPSPAASSSSVPPGRRQGNDGEAQGVTAGREACGLALEDAASLKPKTPSAAASPEMRAMRHAAIVGDGQSGALEPADVLGGLAQNWCDALPTLGKWQDKVASLQLLQKLAEPEGRRLKAGDYEDVVKTLVLMLRDSMVLVRSAAARCICVLALGLSENFMVHGKGCARALVEQLKDQDKRVLQALHAALGALIPACLSVHEFVDICGSYMVAEQTCPVRGKVEILNALSQALRGGGPSHELDKMELRRWKVLSDLLAKCCEDSAEPVRTAATAALSLLVLQAVSAGTPPDKISQLLSSLDSKKTLKVLSLAQNLGSGLQRTAAAGETRPQTAADEATHHAAHLPAQQAPAAPGPTAAAKVAVAWKKAPVNASDSQGPKKTAGKVAVSKAATAPAKSKAEGEKQEAKTEALDLNAGMSVEELDAQMEILYSEATRTKLASGNWKERLEGMQEVLASLLARGTLEQPVPDATCRMVQGLLVTKKETNFQVFAKGFEVVKLMAEKAGKFSMRAAHWLVTPLVEKLGDVKLKTAASECLNSLAEACSPDFMISQALGVLEKTKAPKTLENAVGWINTMCGDFGMKLIKPAPVLGFVKGMLEVANPAVKKAAIQALVTLRRLLGPDLRNMLSDIKPALLTSIDEAFAKVADEEPMEAPRRQVRCADEVAGAAAAGAGDEIVNLTAPIAAHIKALGDANWKERQSAIVAIDELVTKAKPLGCQGPYMEGSCGEMWAALKARLKDSNKNLATQVLALLGKIADAIGPSVDKYSKHVMPNMLALISDNKKTVRDAVLQCLAAWARHISSETVIKYLPIALSVESPAGREDAFKWAADYLAARKSEPVDLSPILVPVMDGLVFRTAEVRNGAERCLSVIYQGGGKQAINNVLRDMKPAQLKGVMPICEKAEMDALGARISEVIMAVEVAESASTPSNPVNGASWPTATPMEEASATSTPTHQGLRHVSHEGVSIDSAPPAAERKPHLTPRRSTGLLGPPVASPHGPVGIARHASSPSLVRSSCPSVIPATPGGLSETLEWLLKRNRGKELRLRKYLVAIGAKAKVVGEDAREIEEMLTSLQDSLAPVAHPQLLSALFSKDVKRQVEGLRLLSDACQGGACDRVVDQGGQREDGGLVKGEVVDSILDNSDLVLRLCSLRIAAAQRGPCVILGALTLMRALFHVLAARRNHDTACEGGVLSEQEAVVCVPCVFEEMGSNNEAVRNEARRLVKGLPCIYPAGCVLGLLLDRAAATRNIKARSECILEAAALLQQHGMDNLSSTPAAASKVANAMAPYVKDRDAAVRSAALDSLLVVQAAVGDRFWKLLVRLDDNHKELIDKHMKSGVASGNSSGVTSRSVSLAMCQTTPPSSSSSRCLSAPARVDACK
jgi:hypothetical protein